MDTEEHPICTFEAQTRSNKRVRNESESREAKQGKTLEEKDRFPVLTTATKTQALRSSQVGTISAQSSAVQLPQPTEPPKCTAVQFQVPVSTSLPICTQSKVLIQTSQVRVQSAPHPVSKALTLPPLRSLKSAPPPPVPFLPAQTPGLPGLIPNHVTNITNPSAQFNFSPVNHPVSQGQVQCKPILVPVSQQQAPQFQVFPQTTQFPNSQPNLIAAAGQVLLPAGISPFQSVSSPLQPCRMPVSSGLPVPPSLPTVVSTIAPPSCVVLHPVPPAQSQAHPNRFPPPQVRIPTQTQVLPRATHIPVPVSPQGQQNTAKCTETLLPFTHMLAPSVPIHASFCSVTTPQSYSMISPNSMRTPPPATHNLIPFAPLPSVQIPLQSTMSSSPCPQASTLTSVPPPGSLPLASSPVLSTVSPRPLPQIQSLFPVQSSTPPAPFQQNLAPCPVSSLMPLGPPSGNPVPCSVPSHMLPVAPLLSSAPCPVPHNPSACQIRSNMPLVALLQNSTPTPISATRPSAPVHQVPTLPPVHSIPMPFQSAHETPQVPLTYPLDSFYASLDPMHDLEEEPDLTTLHPPMFDQVNMLSEHLSSVRSQLCVSLSQPGIPPQTPCITSDQFSSTHSESLTLSEQSHSPSANVDPNGQFRNSPTCSDPPNVSAHQSNGSSTTFESDVQKEGQGHTDSVLVRLRSHFKTRQESNRTRQSETQSDSLNDSEEPKTSKHQLSSVGPINHAEGHMASQNDMASLNDDSAKDGKKIDQKRLAKPGKSQGRKNQCEVCDRVLSNASALENHSRLHTGERPFSCDKCGKAFPSVRGLNRHVQIHAEEKQHQCPECGKSFVYHFTLTKHQLIHTGEKPFPCKVCGKRFLAKADRATHMRMHTAEKPYSCTLCGKKFKHRMALNMHMQGHRGEKRYSCPTCDKGFVDLGNFKRHKRIHTGEKPYECKVCGKRFTQSAHLKKHVNTQH